MPSSSNRVSPSAAHAFVADLADPQLTDDDRHHLFRVMRLRDGEVVTISDGHGRWRQCVVAGAALEPTNEVRSLPDPEPEITVAFALTKGTKPEWVVQKLTEIGVDRVTPFVGEHSVVRWDAEKRAVQHRRWLEVARQAAMQSRRVRIPVIDSVTDFTEVAGRPGASLAEPGGEEPQLSRPLILIGPEGGWSVTEASSGLPRVDLGPTVLRAETAALAAGIRLCALRAY